MYETIAIHSADSTKFCFRQNVDYVDSVVSVGIDIVTQSSNDCRENRIPRIEYCQSRVDSSKTVDSNRKMNRPSLILYTEVCNKLVVFGWIRTMGVCRRTELTQILYYGCLDSPRERKRWSRCGLHTGKRLRTWLVSGIRTTHSYSWRLYRFRYGTGDWIVDGGMERRISICPQEIVSLQMRNYDIISEIYEHHEPDVLYWMIRKVRVRTIEWSINNSSRNKHSWK